MWFRGTHGCPVPYMTGHRVCTQPRHVLQYALNHIQILRKLNMMQTLSEQLLRRTVRHYVNGHLHLAKFCSGKLSGTFFLIFLIHSWLNPQMWKANCTHDTYYYHNRFKERKQRRGLLEKKDEKPSQGNSGLYENERPRR